VQLDKTQIAVRERNMLDVLDLSLHVMRAYARPLLVTFSFGMAPLLVLNYFLLGWMADVEYDVEFPYGFLWNMFLLVYVEAPLASVFATCYLGQAVFEERPSIRGVVHDVARLWHRLTWCQLLLRAVAPVCVLYGFLSVRREWSAWELFLIHVLVMWAVAVRIARPFINEIIVLERNPLRVREVATQSIATRSARLHGPAAGDFFVRSLGAWCIGVLLWLGCYGVILFGAAVWSNDWRQGYLIVTWCYPVSLWMVVFFFTVVRFLSYLDARIRQEGWEVELKLRAEAVNLTSKMA
jgi:hypothetical protein